MLKKISKILFILIFFLLSCYIIYNKENNNLETLSENFKVKYNIQIKEILKDDSIGKLSINRINREFKLYDNEKNNVEENVTILDGSIEPKEDDSIMFIAAHSGTGKIAYFNDLDKLKVDDEVVLYYKGIKYTYVVKDIWETEKDGDIEVFKDEKKQLILTTCSKKNNNKQLIINCTIKES